MACSRIVDRRRPRGTSIATAALITLAVGSWTEAPAFAQKAPSAAQTMFDDAKRLFAAGKVDEACEKFAASQSLESRPGTLMNLAICHEKQGKLATAVIEYERGRTEAMKEKRKELAEYASERIEALRPRLPYLVIRVSGDSKASDVKVALDDVEVPAAVWGTTLPVDPGEHRVQASAPGRKPWKTTVDAVADGRQRTIDIPSLELAHEGTVAAPPPSESPVRVQPDSAWGQRKLGLVLAGGGVVAMGVGAFFGVSTLSKRSDAEQACREGRCDEGRSVNDEAKTLAWLSNIGIGVGALVAAAGAYIFFTSPAARSTATAPPRLRVAGDARRDGAVVTLGAAW